jgi:Transketolase, pyrimidine binding domain
MPWPSGCHGWWVARLTLPQVPRPVSLLNLPVTTRPCLGNRRGRNFHFGVREHAMCAAVNGMTLCGLRAFGSGFLIFTDYARGAIRLASLMDLPIMARTDRPINRSSRSSLCARFPVWLSSVQPMPMKWPSAKRVTASREGKSHSGGRLTNRLGALCWPLWRNPWNAQLRNVGAVADRCRAFRIQSGACGSRRQNCHTPRGRRSELGE